MKGQTYCIPLDADNSNACSLILRVKEGSSLTHGHLEIKRISGIIQILLSSIGAEDYGLNSNCALILTEGFGLEELGKGVSVLNPKIPSPDAKNNPCPTLLLLQNNGETGEVATCYLNDASGSCWRLSKEGKTAPTAEKV